MFLFLPIPGRLGQTEDDLILAKGLLKVFCFNRPGRGL
ncbi:hypothetical protein X474_07340 [Dethiosulfatarculus sandiegensis]|uniref:Uncharacterized protein n=1 Tax=Dethiosulfatarculus sandiegensis TaxID=1429043 RepID=A0A0D2JG46_9BACT|nr:hypothetical protein X474_07340 [Dethiosulfatarculus sandiegensis]